MIDATARQSASDTTIVPRIPPYAWPGTLQENS